MLEKCKAVVLKLSKYSDNSIIVNCYTDLFGKISFIASGVHTKKSKNKISFFQTLSLLELDIYYKEKREVQRIKEVHISYPLVNLPQDIIKSSISFFLAELILKIFRESETNFALYNFIENSVKTLDLLSNNRQISNFHLAFLIQLTKYIGFFPLQNYSEQNNSFNLEQGKFVKFESFSNVLIEPKLSKILFSLAQNGYNNKILLSREERNVLLIRLIDYFNLHIESNMKIKSLEVLTEIFS